jgi:hypothetical protein
MTHLHITRLAMACSVACALIAFSACGGSDAATADAGEARSSSETTSASSERDGGTRRTSQRDERSDAGGDSGRPAADSDGGMDARRGMDAGRTRDAGFDAATGSGVDGGDRDPDELDGGPSGNSGNSGPCPDASTAHPPTIWLLIDGSGSMLSPLGAKTRWAAIRESLLDPTNGLIKRFEGRVQWGLFMYDGPSVNGGALVLPDGGVLMVEPATTCPRVVTVEAKLDNYAAISSVFTAQPLGGSTPTHKALELLLEQLPSEPQARSRTSIVFATDGEPNDFCQDAGAFPPPLDVRPIVVDAVARAAALSVKTYVVNLAADDMLLTEHLEQVAQAGGTSKPPFTPGDQPALTAALSNIVDMSSGCKQP